MIRKKKSSVNVKVKNATKVEYNNVKFDSKLELFAYKALIEAGVTFAYNQITYTILPAFKYNDEHIRPMTYKPDFVGNGWVMETKGFASDSFPLRWKIFKHYLKSINSELKLYLVHNQKEIKIAIEEIARNERILQ
jgi:hypothetical protein